MSLSLLPMTLVAMPWLAQEPNRHALRRANWLCEAEGQPVDYDSLPLTVPTTTKDPKYHCKLSKNAIVCNGSREGYPCSKPKLQQAFPPRLALRFSGYYGTEG